MAQQPAHVRLARGFHAQPADQRALRAAHHPFQATDFLLGEHFQQRFVLRRQPFARLVHGGQGVLVQRAFKQHVVHLAEQADKGRLKGIAEEVGRAAKPGHSAVFFHFPEHGKGTLVGPRVLRRRQ